MTHPVADDVGPMTLTVRDVIVVLGGDLDIASAPAVRERLPSLLRLGACRLVTDMSAVGYADAIGPATPSAATAGRPRRLFPAGPRLTVR